MREQLNSNSIKTKHNNNLSKQQHIGMQYYAPSPAGCEIHAVLVQCTYIICAHRRVLHVTLFFDYVLFVEDIKTQIQHDADRRLRVIKMRLGTVQTTKQGTYSSERKRTQDHIKLKLTRKDFCSANNFHPSPTYSPRDTMFPATHNCTVSPENSFCESRFFAQ